jgi:hypothetical protein
MFKVIVILLLTATTPAIAGEYEQYWDTWHKNAKLIRQCQSEKNVKLFLQNSIADLGNAERTEANAEVIETVILTKPACFLSALSTLSQVQCETVVKFFIQAPIHHDAMQIEKSLKSVHFKKVSCYVG